MKIQRGPSLWRGPSSAHSAAAAAHAAEATAATGSLIKNPAPSQQLWPGPKWETRREDQRKPRTGRWSAIGTRPASCAPPSRSRSRTFKTPSGSTRSQRNLHVRRCQKNPSYHGGPLNPLRPLHAAFLPRHTKANGGVHRQSVSVCVSVTEIAVSSVC